MERSRRGGAGSRYWVYVSSLERDGRGTRRVVYYVGSSSLPVEERFRQHVQHHAGRRRRGEAVHGVEMRLERELTLGPFRTRARAEKEERRMAMRLVRGGNAVRTG